MMIKLFLITLLCATLVFADSLVRDFQDQREKSVSGFLSDHLMGRESNLVRRSAQEAGGSAGGYAGGGFNFNIGVSVSGGAAAGMGGGAKEEEQEAS